MKFQLRECGWPLQGGGSFIPQGTIIDSAGTDQWSALVVALGITMPQMHSRSIKVPMTPCEVSIRPTGSSPSQDLTETGSIEPEENDNA